MISIVGLKLKYISGIIILCLLAAGLCAALTGCAAKENDAITSFDQLAKPGTKIGVMFDLVEYDSLKKDYPDAEIIAYNNNPLGYSDVANGRLDAYVYARKEMELAIENGTKGVRILDDNYSVNPVAVGISPESPIPDLTGKINQFIAELKNDGTLDDMYQRWVVDLNDKIPEIPTAENPKYHLRIGTTGTVMPYSYYVGPELCGYDIELAYRFAQWLGADVEFKIYDFGGIISAASSGDIDCIMSNLYKTAVVEKTIPFSDDLFQVDITAMVRDTGAGPQTEKHLQDYDGKRIGVTTGSIQAMQVEENLPNAEIFYFTVDADMLAALKADRIDALALPEPIVKYMMIENPDLTYLDEPLGEVMEIGAVFPKNGQGQALCDQFSEFIREIRKNGVYEEIQNTWLEADEDKRIVPELNSLPAPNGTLRMAADTSMVPFVYIKDGNPVGIDVDTVVRFCKEYGYGLEIVPVDFAGIIPSVVTGKVDFACSGIAYTPERAESILYSEFTFESRSVIGYIKEDTSSSAGFFDSVKNSFEKTFIRENRWLLFVQGIETTLIITVLSILFGTALGFAVFMLCRNGNIVANKLTGFFVWLVQGMPVVVLLMIFYYIIFGKVAISGTVVSVVGFTLVFGSGVFSMLKAGVGAISRGQAEAAYALGYSDHKAFYRVVLPQALPHFMPAYKGEITALIKATAVVGYVAVQDLTKMGDIVRSRTYEAFFPLIAIAVIYFILAAILIFIVKRIEICMDPRKRRKKSLLKGVDVK